MTVPLPATWSEDRARWESPCGRFYYDPVRAEAIGMFCRTYLRQTKGDWAAKPLELLPWQDILLARPLCGWLRVSDGARRFRRVFVMVAKKNGKSTIASGFGLYFAFGDGEAGAEVYAAAGDEQQARIVWGESATMAEKSPEFLEDAGVDVFKDSLVQGRTNSFFKPLTAKASSKHGFNIHALIFDELHAQKSRTLFETLRKGVSARRQPVTLVITTAGDDRESICYEEYEYACRVRDGAFDDPEVLPVVFQIAPTDDWTAEATWYKANPSLGVAKSIDYMRSEARAAQLEPRRRNDFLRLDLNVWTESRTQWITPEAWSACRRETADPADLSRLPCFLGFDLAETVDLVAVVALFRRPIEGPALQVEVESADDVVKKPAKSLALSWSVDVKAWFFAPEEVIRKRVRERRDSTPWDVWVREGWIRLTPGEITDFDVIRDVVLREIMPRYRIEQAGFDPWHARQFVTALQSDGMECVEVRQGFQTLSPASKLFEALVGARRLTHDGNPVLAWCVANAELVTDPAGNIKPVKPGGDARSSRKIDGVTATLTGLARLMVAPVAAPRRAHFSAV